VTVCTLGLTNIPGMDVISFFSASSYKGCEYLKPFLYTVG
jgi:hypothetical protein